MACDTAQKKAAEAARTSVLSDESCLAAGWSSLLMEFHYVFGAKKETHISICFRRVR